MRFSELVTPDGIVAALKATGKKQAINFMAKIASNVTGLQERDVFEVLLEREKLGTTGIGNGVAIPHGKVEGLDKPCCIIARAKMPINFDSVDGHPVDLIFLLLTPEGAGADHLKALAKISRLLRDENSCEKLRGSENADAIYALLLEADMNEAA